MTAGRGLGGTPDRPPGYTPPDQPGVAAGSPNVVRAKRVIIVGTGGELLVYSPTAAAGSLIASIAGVAGVDPFGNNFLQNVATYSGTSAAQMTGSDVDFYGGSLAGGWTLKSQIVGDAVGGLSLTAQLLSLFANGGTINLQSGSIPQSSAGVTTVAQVVSKLISAGVFS